MIVVGYYSIRLVVHMSVGLSVYLSCSSVPPSVFSIPDDNVSKYQWIFTKLSVCTVIVEIWFGIVNEQILLIF